MVYISYLSHRYRFHFGDLIGGAVWSGHFHTSHSCDHLAAIDIGQIMILLYKFVTILFITGINLHVFCFFKET